MTLEEVFAELEALKPAFSKEFDKSDIQYITNELAKRFDKLTKEQDSCLIVRSGSLQKS